MKSKIELLEIRKRLLNVNNNDLCLREVKALRDYYQETTFGGLLFKAGETYRLWINYCDNSKDDVFVAIPHPVDSDYYIIPSDVFGKHEECKKVAKTVIDGDAYRLICDIDGVQVLIDEDNLIRQEIIDFAWKQNKGDRDDYRAYPRLLGNSQGTLIGWHIIYSKGEKRKDFYFDIVTSYFGALYYKNKPITIIFPIGNRQKALELGDFSISADTERIYYKLKL